MFLDRSSEPAARTRHAFWLQLRGQGRLLRNRLLPQRRQWRWRSQRRVQSSTPRRKTSDREVHCRLGYRIPRGCDLRRTSTVPTRSSIGTLSITSQTQSSVRTSSQWTILGTCAFRTARTIWQVTTCVVLCALRLPIKTISVLNYLYQEQILLWWILQIINFLKKKILEIDPIKLSDW